MAAPARRRFWASGSGCGATPSTARSRTAPAPTTRRRSRSARASSRPVARPSTSPRALEAILRELDRPPARALTARAPLQRAQIVAARPFVANLAQRLRDVERPHAAGVARARQLVVDGTSPLYTPSHPGALARLAWRAADAL